MPEEDLNLNKNKQNSTKKTKINGLKGLNVSERRKQLRPLIGLFKTRYLSNVFGVDRGTIFRDIKSLEKEEVDETTRAKILLQTNTIKNEVVRRIRGILDGPASDAVKVNAIRALQKHIELMVKVPQDLGYIELPTQEVGLTGTIDVVLENALEKAREQLKDKEVKNDYK